MAWIGVAEAARRLGVGSARVHQRIADGSLSARRIGSQWAIDESSLALVAERHRPGRPLSERSAWYLIAAGSSDAEALSGATAVERGRAEKRLAELLSRFTGQVVLTEVELRESARDLRLLLRNRAQRRLWRASVRDLPDLREDRRIALSGLSDPHSGIASGDLVEGYVEGGQVEALVHDYLLVEEVAESRANVVLHIGRHVSAAGEGRSLLLLAADLVEYRRPREEARAAELLSELANSRIENDPSGESHDRPT
ncbi:helix-turn-helix domain-containing protein [Kineosporia sp. J2-2]|uniref:Helix-turn-helix domain-containing protein n=1 Tax=Kineosporia corallincola TaxID=2835133 RepID=A0ABS5TC18_9ACTN|nr:helix-turn-helix domain-containing protein [Kineosporia corallincola]MBT0767954.1 helix-turn-helix domain-containing protein [Kineosporia corallincola]